MNVSSNTSALLLDLQNAEDQCSILWAYTGLQQNMSFKTFAIAYFQWPDMPDTMIIKASIPCSSSVSGMALA